MAKELLPNGSLLGRRVARTDEVIDGQPNAKRARCASSGAEGMHVFVQPVPRGILLPLGHVVAMNNEAVCLLNSGDVLSASDLFRKAATQVPHHGVVTLSAHSLTPNPIMGPPKTSYMYQRMEFDEGMRVYTDPEQLNLVDHSLILESKLLFNAGQIKTSLGDYISAAQYYSAALQYLSTSPSLHLGIVSVKEIQKASIPILHNLGQLAYRDGQLKEALTFYDTALKYGMAVYGKEHLSVGLTLNCKGVIYYHTSVSLGPQALACFEKALGILSQQLGKLSPTIATVWNNIGRVYVQTENFASSLVCYEKALEVRCAALGKDHVDYAATAFNTGQSLHHLGKHEKAIELYEEFLRVALCKFSKDHRDIAVVLGSIAQIHQERKDYDKAFPLYMESLRVARAALGPNHPEVAMILNRIGNFHFEREELDKALKAYKMGFRIEKKVLLPSHPNIIVTLSNIGEVYRQQRLFTDSLSFYTRALTLQKNRFGPASAEVAGALNVIGLIHDQTGKSDLALQCLQEALVIRRTVLGDKHIDVSATLTYLGTIFYRRNMVNMALQLFEESLRIRIEKLGKDHQDVSFTLYNAGLCHQLLGNAVDAVRCFEETLRIERLILGDDHKDAALTFFKLGEAHKSNGNFKEALKCFRSTLDVEGLRPATVARAHNEVANILLEQGEVGPSVEAFSNSARQYVLAGRGISAVRISAALKLHRADFGRAAPVA